MGGQGALQGRAGTSPVPVSVWGAAWDEELGGGGPGKTGRLSARPELLRFHVRQLSGSEARGTGAPWGRRARACGSASSGQGEHSGGQVRWGGVPPAVPESWGGTALRGSGFSCPPPLTPSGMGSGAPGAESSPRLAPGQPNPAGVSSSPARAPARYHSFSPPLPPSFLHSLPAQPQLARARRRAQAGAKPLEAQGGACEGGLTSARPRGQLPALPTLRAVKSALPFQPRAPCLGALSGALRSSHEQAGG